MFKFSYKFLVVVTKFLTDQSAELSFGFISSLGGGASVILWFYKPKQ